MSPAPGIRGAKTPPPRADVQQDGTTIRFSDRCGRSFRRYEGMWALTSRPGGSVITYELTATPAFDVPEFLLKRLLRRDASPMIERLRAEIAARVRLQDR